MAQNIRPSMVKRTVGKCLIHFGTNPGGCTCGRYEFYSICGHLYRDVLHRCGAKTSKATGKAILCSTPAPRAVIANFVVNVRCKFCRNANMGLTTAEAQASSGEGEVPPEEGQTTMEDAQALMELEALMGQDDIPTKEEEEDEGAAEEEGE